MQLVARLLELGYKPNLISTIVDPATRHTKTARL